MTDGVCPTCGARGRSAEGFCPSCGTYLDWASDASPSPAPGARTAAAEPPPPGTTAASVPGPAPRPRRKPENRRPLDDQRARRAGLLAYRPLTASAVPGHSTAGAPGTGLADPARAWLNPLPGPSAGSPRTGGMCRRCGLVNPPGRRYCRCGNRIQPFAEPPAPASSPAPAERGSREFGTAMRAAGKGRRPRFDKPLSGRTRAVRGVTVAGVLALALIPLTPPGASAISRLSGSAMSLVPYEYDEVAISGATVDPADAAVPHYVPDYAVDRTGARAWAVAWTDPPLPVRCGASAAPALVIGFNDPTEVSRVIVNAGLDPADTNRTKQLAPAVIDIALSDGECERLDLADGSADQEFRVSAGPARQARVQIVAVTPAKVQDKDTDRPPLTALSEIRFYQG